MNDPMFSLVIPTLRRSDTIEHALGTALRQSESNMEIVVQNNGRDPAVEGVIHRLNDPRIRHFWTEDVLTMSNNWEVALDNSRGKYVTFIGDDDGIFSDACHIARSIFEKHIVEILSWNPYCYYWPRFQHERLQGRIIASIDYNPKIIWIESESQLRRLYGFEIDYSRLPMIYNSFVHRDVVSRVKAKFGRYFFGSGPDVTSGIINAAYTTRFARISRPLTMTGLSKHSTGHSLFSHRLNTLQESQITRDVGGFSFDSRLVLSNNLYIFIANEMLLMQRELFPERPITLSFRGLVETMAARINDWPETYNETLEAIYSLMRMHSLSRDLVVVPPPQEQFSTALGGRAVGPEKISFMMDGNILSLAHIGDAVRLIEQMSPVVEAGSLSLTDEASKPFLGLPGALSFGEGGVGVSALEAGWSEVEHWGVWSVAKEATLTFFVEPNPMSEIILGIHFRSFINEKNPVLGVICSANGREVVRWTCSIKRWAGIEWLTIPSDIIEQDGAVRLLLTLSDIRSPLELGLNQDVRLLGIGLESLERTEVALTPKA